MTDLEKSQALLMQAIRKDVMEENIEVAAKKISDWIDQEILKQLINYASNEVSNSRQPNI